MKARALIEGAVFGPELGPEVGPEAIKVMGQAFAEAWANIAGNYSDVFREEAFRLASAILSIAKDGNKRWPHSKRLASRP